MSNQIVYRVQGPDGRGPWRPGFSRIWVRENPDMSLRPIYVMHDRQQVKDIRLQPGWSIGCGCRSVDQLRRWFDQTEYAKLKLYRFGAYEVDVHEIIGEDENQIVFTRSRPLTEGVTEFNLYQWEAVEAR